MKDKLSVYLTGHGFFATRSQSHNAIKEGRVTVNGRVIMKDGFVVDDGDEISVSMPENQYVSRGGYKLESALKENRIRLEGKTVLDFGASTGGFTDCCLQNGASRVYAYDVGHDQLAEKLRNDPRIFAKEGVNCRYLKADDFPQQIDFICMDVSFISCTKMMDAVSNILNKGGEAVILFKPQFEVGPKHLNSHGICIDNDAVQEAMANCKSAADKLKLYLKNTTPSPITGQDGNQEYLMYFIKE